MWPREHRSRSARRSGRPRLRSDGELQGRLPPRAACRSGRPSPGSPAHPSEPPRQTTKLRPTVPDFRRPPPARSRRQRGPRWSSPPMPAARAAGSVSTSTAATLASEEHQKRHSARPGCIRRIGTTSAAHESPDRTALDDRRLSHWHRGILANPFAQQPPREVAPIRATRAASRRRGEAVLRGCAAGRGSTGRAALANGGGGRVRLLRSAFVRGDGPMPVDNQMYDRLSDTWWEDDGFLNVLKSALNPSRFGYMRRILTEDLGHDPKRLRILDVGCGGGLLAEEFARLGCAVTGVDPSTDSLEVARAHAREGGLDIDYREATGDALPFADGEFPAAYCCDVLEHVDDVGRTVAEIARVLQPGGVFLYDTVNRTCAASC